MSRMALLMLVGVVLTACSTTMPGGLGKANTPVDQRRYEILGTATGKSKGTFVLGIQASKPSVDEAITRAVRFLDGDALINISTMQKKTSWVILPVSTLEVTVTGEVIRFTDKNP